MIVQLKERVQKGPAGDPFVAKARIYMALVDNPGTLPDPAPDAPDPDDFNNPTNRPGRQASQSAASCLSGLTGVCGCLS